MREGSLFYFYWCFWLMANLASGLWLFHACWPGGYRVAGLRYGGEPQGSLVHSGYGNDKGL